MAWTAEKVKAMRESNPAKATESDGWTAEKVRAMRTKTPTAGLPSQAADAASSPKGGALGSTENFVQTAQAATDAEDTLYADALDSYRTGGAMARQSPAAKWGGVPSIAPLTGKNVLEDTTSGAKAYGTSLAQKQKQYNDQHSQTDEFDAINQWLDTGDNKNLADAVRRVDNTNGVYTDKDLITKGGWTQEQIDTARQMNAALDAIPAWKRGVRRTANTIGGVADTVAAAPFLAGEYAVQTGKNLAQSAANRKALEAEVARSPREKNLYERLMKTDMEYQPKYSTGDLLQQGFTREEIDSMKARIAGTEAQDSVDPEKSLGYQLFDRGQELNAAAQSGLSPAARTALGVATSTAENLAVAGVNPAAVLPVLSAQGAAEAMGQSVESGQSAGKALAGGLAKFGAGWAINSVGAADLARTMGSDYAKDTVAGQIADWVRGLAGDGALAKSYPAVANAISGGMDNAMQAFVETYADQAIDAALGDEEAAKTMFSKETFLNALESGLSGGASGALGGAVGTGLAKYNSGDSSLRGQAEYYAAQADAKQAARQQRKALERTMEPGEAAESLLGMPSQSPNGDSSPKVGALGRPGNTEQDAVGTMGREKAGPAIEGSTSENPAVQQFAQVAASDSLTGKTIGLFTPGEGNEANRAAFEEAYGVQLPGTAAATRRMLRSIAAQQQVAQSQETSAADSFSDRALARQDLSGADAPALLERRALGRTGNSEQTAQVLTDAEERALLPRVESAETQNQVVENTGESVESSPAELRETIGLQEAPTENQKMNQVEQKLRSWQVSEKAAENLSKQMPSGLNADTYVAAASSMYRLGQMEDVDTFDKALRLAGSENALGLNVNMVLEKSTGRNVLEQAYLYGKGEQEARAQQMKKLGGALGAQSTSGEGVTYYRGTLRPEDAVASQIISLNAQGTGTDAVLKSVLNGPDGAPNANVRAYVDTETARIFFGDSAQDVFSTVLHEDYHWYNALDAEGAKTLQDHALLYLAQKNGYENIDEMIRAKMGDYAAQSLSYEQAAEELVADAWGGIFDSEESVRRWAQFQRAQADKNAGRAGSIHKVMQQVKTMLENIISKAKEVLRIDPENTAAKKAQRLAEAEKRALQEEYFAHAEKAMDNLRAAKAAENKNAAALKTEDAAEKLGTRFQLHEGKDSLVEQMNQNLERLEPMKTVATIKGTEVSFGANRKENIANIAEYFDSIGNRVVRQDFGTVELTAKSARTTIQHGNSAAKQAAVAAVPEIIRNGEQIGYEKNWQGRGYDTYVFAAPVEINGVRLYESAIVNEYIRDNGRKIFYVHEVCWTDGSYVTLNDQGVPTKKENIPTPLPKAVRSRIETTQETFSNNNIAQTSAERNRTDEPVKKTTRFQIHNGFEKAIDELDVNSKYAYPIRVGTTSEVLKSIGVKDQTIVWNSNKIRKILAKHSAENFRTGADRSIMTKEILKQVPQVLEHPILVVHSDTTRNADYASRIFMYGDVKDATGKPVNVSLELLPTDHKGLAMENIVVLSAYGHDAYRPGRVLQGEILYADPNTKRTSSWLRDNRLLLPFSLASAGSKAILRYSENGVKAVTVKPLPGQRKYYLKSITEEQAQKLYPAETKRTDTQPAVNRLQLPLRMAEYGSEDSVHSAAENVKADEKTNVRFQMAESADRDARKNTQRQASRAIAERDASLKTLMDFFGITRGVRISDDSLEGMALRIINGSGAKGKLHSSEFAKELRPLVEYLKADGADMQKAQSMAEVLAGEVLDHATTRNTELWDQYPELHDLSYTVAKGGQAEAELARRYGTWGAAVKDARSHGVQLRREAGYRDSNPVEQYESIVNDTRSVGGVKDGAAALFRTAAKNAGVAGAASMESAEWLEVLMNVHDAIKPRMMSRFADVAEYEDAKVELAGRMLGEVMNLNEMTDVQTIFNGIQKHNREVAAAAAGSEERAAEVLKSLKGVQREQTREFNRRLYENSKAAAQSDEAKAFARQEQKNRAAERLLDQNLDMLGVDITNIGDLNEKLEVLRETYDREWKAEKQRMREERRQMLDDIALERRQLKAENAELARQVAGEQRRADRAERQLIFQENDILEWEQENQRKADAWQQEQAQRNAIAIETARQQRDEDIAVAKALAEKRVQKAREGRQKDELRRSIQRNAAQLNQMVLRPAPGKYVQKSLIVQAAEVAKLADLTVMNFKAVQRLEALRTSIKMAQGTEGSASGVSVDWEQSGVMNMIDTLEMDLTATKQAQLDRLHQQMEEAKALPDSEKARALQDRLQQRINETENRVYLPMTVDQMRMLKAITASTLHVIRTANKTLSLEKAKEVDAFAQKTAHEVLAAKGNEPGEKWSRTRKALTLYNLDMLGAKRVFRMLGGYTKNGQMEQLADILNEGQRKQTQITVEGTALFDNVTGKANVKNMEQFAGPGAELVDVGLKDTKGNAVPLTHAQLCSLYMHLKNADSRNHLLTGGLTLPDAKAYHKGDIEAAYQKGQTVQLGSLLNADGTPMADTIVQTVEKAMTDYDRAWCKDMEDFFGRYTTNLINETSMKLLGYQRATVKNYYPIAVDKTQLAIQIEGLKLDATIEGRGFLKNRVKSSQPILLEECNNVVQRSLRDTAAYAGLAAPIRDVQKILNSGVETAQGVGILKNKIIKEHWGREAVDYIDYLLTDLQSTQRKRMDGIGRGLGKLRGNYAGAILTLNPGVAIAQAASLPTAGAVLGADTMAAVVPFVKNLSGKQRAALEAEISQHGDVLLRYRMRGSQLGELASIGVDKGLAQNAMDKLPKSLTGWINGMDEITVAALWEGAKRYVEHHADQFDGNAADKGSEAYWNAVNKMYQKVIEETQPNYTTMQRAGIQRSDNEITKTLTMFTTQRFQNYGILADAVGDYNAQRARYKTEASAANKAEMERAGKQLNRAVASQLTQTAVFALMKIGADFLLHRWDRERDENGDVTAASMGKRFLNLYTESFAGNFLFGSELYTLVGNYLNGTDYDVVSATNISAVNDTFESVLKFITLVKRDTSEMDEAELEKYHQKLVKAGMDVLEYGFELLGVPLGNAEKMRQAIMGYWEDAKRLKAGEKLSLNGLPASATGQYDRLYNAIQSGDAEEAAAARAKLEAMGKDDKTIYSQLKTRLKKYDGTIQKAAKAQVAGDDATRRKLTENMVLELYETLGIDRTDKADAAKREQVIDLVTGAITDVANAQLKGGRDGLYDDLSDALDSGRVKDVQDELNRLMTAGKKADSLKSKVTELVKPVYLAGNDHDRAQMETMLLKLEDDSGGKLYERKNFEQWVKQAKKKEEQDEKTTDEWAGLR